MRPGGHYLVVTPPRACGCSRRAGIAASPSVRGTSFGSFAYEPRLPGLTLVVHTLIGGHLHGGSCWLGFPPCSGTLTLGPAGRDRNDIVGGHPLSHLQGRSRAEWAAALPRGPDVAPAQLSVGLRVPSTVVSFSSAVAAGLEIRGASSVPNGGGQDTLFNLIGGLLAPSARLPSGWTGPEISGNTGYRIARRGLVAPSQRRALSST